MIAAMLGMVIFGAIFGIAGLFKSARDGRRGTYMPRRPEVVMRAPKRPAWTAVNVRDKRRPHAPGRSRGKSPHHAGL